MQRSAQLSGPTNRRRRRIIAITAAAVVIGGMLTVTQVSDAASRRFGWGSQRQQQAACPTATSKRYNTETDLATSQNGQVEQHTGDGQASSGALERAARERGRNRDRNCTTPSTGATATPSVNEGDGDNNGGDGDGDGSSNGRVAVPPGGADGANNGQEILGADCTNSQLNLHDGFQNAPACSQTMFGEVPAQEKGASLLITEHPDQVGVNEAFSFTVSTRNLKRDRFLGAAAGGYYLESSFLNEDAIVRGHFHSACQLLQGTDEAPTPDRAQFFVATEDGGGTTTPDSVTINVPGLAAAGTYKCASWAGDGSHRVPMMQFANQIPAIDAFQLVVE